ncbi:MAG: YbhB/YbcL family Raf kinase inhibitor-like protein [Bacteroidetes bacterium]|nr:YbhB/YbcL family Raf kinase inhibitor-like protein [Bacteroidota bacterium]
MMKASCPALQTQSLIPNRYAYRGVQGGQNISLPVAWSDEPSETRSFALTIIDRHPVARNWIHWCIVQIPAGVHGIPEGASGDESQMPGGSIELLNSYGEPGYGGPKPPHGSGPHEYVISVHALAAPLPGISRSSTYRDIEQALQGNILATAEVAGVFEQL